MRPTTAILLAQAAAIKSRAARVQIAYDSGPTVTMTIAEGGMRLDVELNILRAAAPPWKATVRLSALAAVIAESDGVEEWAGDGAGGLRLRGVGSAIYHLPAQPAICLDGLAAADVPADAAFLPHLAPVADVLSLDPARLALGCVCLDEGAIVATDGYRMHIIDAPRLPRLGLLPAHAVALVALVEAGLRVAADQHAIRLVGAGVRLAVTRPEDLEYPDWRRVVPRPRDGEVVVGVYALAAAVRRAATMARETAGGRLPAVIVEVAGGTVWVRGESAAGAACAMCDCEGEGKQGPVPLGAQDMLDALDAIDSPTARIHLGDGTSAMTLAGNRVSCIVMPRITTANT